MEERFDLYSVAISFFLTLSFAFCYFQIGLGGSESSEFHEEIIPSAGISYIKNYEAIMIPDGNYSIAVPSKDTFLRINGHRIHPLFLIMIPDSDSKMRLYPLNVKDNSILPHIGKTLALHILMEFRSTYGANRLTYDEKHPNIPARISYSKKVYYYLHVENGFGTIERGYLPRDSLALKWYKKPEYVQEEMAAIYFLTNRIPYGTFEIQKSLEE